MSRPANRIFYDLPNGWAKRALIFFNINSTATLYNWLTFKKKNLANYNRHLQVLEFLRNDMIAFGLREDIVEQKIALLKKEYEVSNG